MNTQMSSLSVIDVVTAYKSLSKEKEAMEASLIALSALTASQVKETKERVAEASSSTNGEESDGNAEAGTDVSKKTSPTPLTEETLNTENEVEETPSEQLRLQLATLTNSLSTLSAEKSKMEAGFQADKKKLRQEKEEVCIGLLVFFVYILGHFKNIYFLFFKFYAERKSDSRPSETNQRVRKAAPYRVRNCKIKINCGEA